MDHLDGLKQEKSSGISSSDYLETVRALHQTVVSLRGALEESREEISKLKAWPLEDLQSAISALSIENHLLRQKIIDRDNNNKAHRNDGLEKRLRNVARSLENLSTTKAQEQPATTQKLCKKVSVSLNLEIYKKMERDGEAPPPKKTAVLQHSPSTDMLDQEVDDIELIFTNEDTKESNLKEPLISIEPNHCQHSEFDQNLSADISDRELEDDVFNDNFENENQENTNFQSQTLDSIYNSKSDNSINRDESHGGKSLKSCYSYQDSSFENKSLEKDESFDRFEERVRIVETDMSKVGIQDPLEIPMGRRNTCPNPIQYRPIIHREAIGKGLGGRKARPILAHSNAIRKESGAQTEISALPGNSSWRSESSLANKAKLGENFTTLPSKYPMPGSRLRLSEKTVEARRILLSDIGFTSMVPELSRSADHLCPPHMKTSTVSSYGQFLKTTDLYSPGFTSQKFVFTSPSESHSQSRYSSLYPLPSPPAPSRRCSAPVSPSRRNIIRHVPSKVRFANGSLPELRGDWNSTMDSGDSTDSLVEEAEHYLRRSIDCIVSGRDAAYYSTPKTSMRRASAPEPSRDNVPPQGWQPFLPRLPRDLRLDYWVKVITPEGRVRGGRVRYIGHLLSHSEQFVGVQLSSPEGHSDGTYNNRRYFQCEPYHGLFVPFKKVIMGWKP
ncbi:PREDICTED: uncharacterized protein LOC108566895 [Nicrophorus vespilloides]|uniref:Uncharacterized protein LOC108566895 n=1 Tax=Nicrophorus vespilloides TaxID=110193 RepID=A0ABM1N6P6_NICVS|nr:PREDICTED: uncharacterized protein LOC108566895 [Nicrophorus vespilloides]